MKKLKGTGVTPSVSFVLGAANEKQVVNIDCGNGEEEFDVDVAQNWRKSIYKRFSLYRTSF